jgi:hypothetical protein
VDGRSRQPVLAGRRRGQLECRRHHRLAECTRSWALSGLDVEDAAVEVGLSRYAYPGLPVIDMSFVGQLAEEAGFILERECAASMSRIIGRHQAYRSTETR